MTSSPTRNDDTMKSIDVATLMTVAGSITPSVSPTSGSHVSGALSRDGGCRKDSSLGQWWPAGKSIGVIHRH